MMGEEATDKSQYRVSRLLAHLFALLALTNSAGAWCQQTMAVSDADSGIYVGAAKVYDDRALSIMLEELNAQLQTFRAIDRDKTLGALLNQQGYSSVSTATSLQLTSPITPKVSTSQSLGDDGSLRVDGVQTETSENKPQPPTLPDFESQIAYAPSYGQSAQDILSSQVNLSYQIYNIRMALERAVSDRLDGNAERAQAVLAFPITIDPPRGAQDRAAYVEISLKSLNAKHISLVSLMPTEKSYNSAALSKKANAFGGSAVTSLLTLGLSRSSNSETFYVYQDVDTLAVQFPQNDASTIRFGWVFRPVLGRRSVSPGARQLIAVVAVGGDTEESKALPRTSAGDELQASVRTYWRKYDRKRLTMGSRLERVTGPTPLGGGSKLFVIPPDDLHKKLAPKVTYAQWTATGLNSAVTSIQGRNFFPGTQVLLGGHVFSDANNGLIIKSETTMELRSSLADLAFGEAFVSGRYSGDEGQQVVQVNDKYAGGIAISAIVFDTDLTSQTTALTVQLQSRNGSLLEGDRVRDRILITVGEQLAPLPYQFRTINCDVYSRVDTGATLKGNPVVLHTQCAEVEMRVPSEWLRGDVTIGARIPFMPRGWSDALVSYGVSKGVKLVYLGGKDPVEFALVGIDKSGPWHITAEKRYSAQANTLAPLVFKFDAKAIAAYKRVVVTPPGGESYLLDIPAAAPPPAKPDVDNTNPPAVAVNFSGMIAIAGSHLDSIESAEFEGAKLTVDASKANSLGIFVTRKVTEKPGSIQLILKSSQGKIMPASVIVKP